MRAKSRPGWRTWSGALLDRQWVWPDLGPNSSLSEYIASFAQFLPQARRTHLPFVVGSAPSPYGSMAADGMGAFDGKPEYLPEYASVVLLADLLAAYILIT